MTFWSGCYFTTCRFTHRCLSSSPVPAAAARVPASSSGNPFVIVECVPGHLASTYWTFSGSEVTSSEVEVVYQIRRKDLVCGRSMALSSSSISQIC